MGRGETDTSFAGSTEGEGASAVAAAEAEESAVATGGDDWSVEDSGAEEGAGDSLCVVVTGGGEWFAAIDATCFVVASTIASASVTMRSHAGQR